MKLLHTSDWHLGRSLYGKKRYRESEAFLDWLVGVIGEEKIDVLLVAGDVFDNSTPSNKAQELYYRFLCRVSESCCSNVVVIAGNHDSPSFLNAPRDLLSVMNVHVIGSVGVDPSSEVLVLYDERGTPILVVGAVPYLRDRDIRTVEPGESISDKTSKLVQGLLNHYMQVCEIAETRQRELADSGHTGVPIVAMGHLFTAGGKTVADDGVRELYAGSLVHVDNDVFPLFLDYVALGHLHVPQSVGEGDRIRYSGSPMPMGFRESKQAKSVVVVDFSADSMQVELHPVPCFQKLERISGSLEDIYSRIDQLKTEQSDAWLEIEYTGKSVASNLREDLNETLQNSLMEIRRIRNKQIYDRVISTVNDDETLDDLEPGDVFQRCLEAYSIPEDERTDLVSTYDEIMNSLLEDDSKRD